MEVAESQYRVILLGSVQTGKEESAVAAALASLLKIDNAKAARLLATDRTVIKSGLTREAAEKYWRAFNSVGAVSKIENAAPPAPMPDDIQAGASPRSQSRVPLIASFTLGVVVGGLSVGAYLWPASISIEPPLQATATTNQTAENSFSISTNWVSKCTEMSSLAETIMSGRQSGVSMAQMMETVGDIEIGQRMIIAAYDVPRYRTEKHIQNAIKDFRDELYLECAKALKK